MILETLHNVGLEDAVDKQPQKNYWTRTSFIFCTTVPGAAIRLAVVIPAAVGVPVPVNWALPLLKDIPILFPSEDPTVVMPLKLLVKYCPGSMWYCSIDANVFAFALSMLAVEA